MKLTKQAMNYIKVWSESDGNKMSEKHKGVIEACRELREMIILDSPTATHDPINHPAHYTSHPAKCECGKGIECIQVTEHMTFCLGNAVKYVWRADLKHDDAITDLRKAVWYIEREIAKRGKHGK